MTRSPSPRAAGPADGAPVRRGLADTPGGPQIILRAFLGVTFTYAGLQKLTNRYFFEAANPGSIQAQLHASITTSPIGPLIRMSAHEPVLVGLLIAFGELAVGLGTLFGLFGRVAAGGGMAVSLLLFLSVSFNTTPYFYGSDIVFLFAWTPLLLGGSGAWSLDAALEARHRGTSRGRRGPAAAAPDLDRRAAVRKVASALALASFAVVTAAIAAAVGRMFGGASVQASGAPQLPPPSNQSPSAGSPSGGCPRRAQPLASPATCRSAAPGSSPTLPRGSPPMWSGPPRDSYVGLQRRVHSHGLHRWLLPARAPVPMPVSRLDLLCRHRRGPPRSRATSPLPGIPIEKSANGTLLRRRMKNLPAATGRRTDDLMAAGFSRMLVVINLSPGCH